MAQIYLVRHGQASFGSQNYDQLSPLGLQQAQHLGRWWAARALVPDRVICGAMMRHQQTAAACMAELGAGDQGRWQAADAGFNEYNHHEVLARHMPAFDDPAAVKHFLLNTVNGKQEFQAIFAAAITRWMSGLHAADYSETWPAFSQRCIAALTRQLALADDAKHIAIFTSGGTISALCQHVLGFPDAKFSELNWSLVNSGVTRLHVQPGRLGLAGLNNFSHLEVLNDSRNITYV
ncbi:MULTISPECIES: histidine phosphatase family protein [unclassified Undibacterium]|uniref:histidine phosphatase family protein n=1 Tax=unclassified Undibacterium TaxID=2630295 RepID=UPI002AC97633|nr:MULTISPECIES: histidine phosphatase family protein [unclassified Undibacterium]MEB0139793.1 histidine phosphatase family protein [Undibacterium sp. CCC2.1]MEB0170499.1 histidine phosphatase family protein [Undibacterium sp. CCC1.1]MEB0174440.1 histidine phosphatase family protein [Undibacterium sp. CCC3.4]MEB0213763.1 histidine phosphatase family protein [Undibacterium sp. 5I2]WPX43926.1 histidine phosphatase family protein [Undibacterium sp. CCC3.4]